MLARRNRGKKPLSKVRESATKALPSLMELDDTDPVVLDPADLERHTFLLNKVFTNDLIWDNVASFLNPTDMKMASQTCHLLLHKVRCFRKFSDNMKLIVCRESYKSKTLGTKFRWKCVDIELSTLPLRAMPSVKKIMHHVEALELYEAYGVQEKEMNHFLLEILSNSPKLKSLWLDCTILEKKLDIFSDPAVLVNFKNLEELRITTGRRDTTRHIGGVDGQKGPFPQNILKISAIPLKLKTFYFGKIDSYYGGLKEHNAFTPKILENCCATLTELDLRLHIWNSSELQKIVCPALKKLHLTAYRQHEANVIAFLLNQPLLESLEVQCKNGFPKTVLKAIQTRSSKLKRLHLKGSSFTGSNESIDWSFLGSMQYLKDFRMFQPRSFLGEDETQATCFEYLSSLPGGVSKVALRGLESGWSGNVALNTITCLTRFSNLTEISLMRCENALDDQVMQFICLNITKLTVFKFSHCRALTDFGICGRRGNENTGISLKSLKGLREFTMRECREITHEGLLNSIEFLELVRLDLAICPQPIPKDSLVQIAKQNPSLESLTVNFAVVEEVTADVKAANPRINRVIYVNEDWAYEDSDSDAEDIDEEFESSEDGSFGWQWNSDLDDDDMFFPYNYSDYSDQDDLF